MQLSNSNFTKCIIKNSTKTKVIFLNKKCETTLKWNTSGVPPINKEFTAQ